MKRFTLLLIQLGAVLATGTVEAADREFYVGGSMSRAETDVESGLASSYDASDGGYKLLAGTRLWDWFAVEASYLDLGQISFIGPIPSDAAFFYEDQKAFEVSGVFLLQLRKIELHAKAGLARWDTEGSYDSIAGPIDFSENGTDVVWGIGVQGTVGDKIALRLEYERLELEDVFETFGTRELVSVGFTWTFR